MGTPAVYNAVFYWFITPVSVQASIVVRCLKKSVFILAYLFISAVTQGQQLHKKTVLSRLSSGSIDPTKCQTLEPHGHSSASWLSAELLGKWC